MAKALMGHLTVDQRSHHAIADNARLRRRIADLEALVARLQSENDALTAAHAQALIDAATADLISA